MNTRVRLVDILRVVREGWFLTICYRDKDLRANFCPRYGIELSFFHKRAPEIVFNLFIHRYALFLNTGRRYKL